MYNTILCFRKKKEQNNIKPKLFFLFNKHRICDLTISEESLEYKSLLLNKINLIK